MANGAFKIGDKVKLKSGGPDMTIQEIADWDGDGTMSADCVWFDDKNKPESRIFKLAVLELVTD